MADKEYDLKQSAKNIGYLEPVKIGKDNHIIDGVHRLKEDNNWPRQRLEHIDTKKKRLIARLAANFIRRTPPKRELRSILNDLAAEYRSEGQEGSLTEIIAKETGITPKTVRKYLKGEYKDLRHAVRESNLKTQVFKSKVEARRNPYLLSADWKCPVCNENVAVYCNGEKHKFDNRGKQ